MGSKYNLNAPEELWDSWKRTVSREYPRLGGRILDLLALDLVCHEEFGYGIIEYMTREGIIQHDTVEARVTQARDAEDEDDTDANS